jgi:hypothetical protein
MDKFIEVSKLKHGNKYDYSKVNYINNLTEVSITCLSCYSSFNQLPKVHKKGGGCTYCSKKLAGLSRRSSTDDFIKKAKEKHGNKYDYSKVVYIKAIEKIEIICSVHGMFEQTPNSHLRGKGCRKCSTIINADNARSSTDNFIKKAKEKHSNEYDYSLVVYINAVEKVIIICKVHGRFEQTPNSHLGGHKCYQCHGPLKSTTDNFIKKSKEKHGDTYDYSSVVYISAVDKVSIICKTHDVFDQTPNNHLNGNGCPTCGYKSWIHSTHDFIQHANEIHGDAFVYSHVKYNKMNEKVNIICKVHGMFEQTPSNHITHAQGCQSCAGNYTSTTEEFIRKAKLIHGDIYNYSKVVYVNNHTPVIIGCEKHGFFEQTPQNHLCSKCKDCGIESMKESQRTSPEEFLERALNVHGEYEYPNLHYVNAKTKIEIICSVHGMFEQTPDSHLRGSGCPKCYKKYSHPQIQWLTFISEFKKIQIQHAENYGEFSIPETKFKADGFCKETNTIYEFHGDFWHGNPKIYSGEKINPISKKTFGELYQSTMIREKQIKELGFNLVVMWESDWNKINKTVKVLQRKFRNHE